MRRRYNRSAEGVADLIVLLIARRAPLTLVEIQRTLPRDRQTLTCYCEALGDKGLVERDQVGNAFTYRWIGQE